MAIIEKYPSRSAAKFIIRMPEGMRDRLKFIAKSNHRSMNAEIVSRLAETLDQTYKKESSEVFQIQENAPALSYEEQIIINAVRQMSSEKKKALLTIISI